MKHGTISGYVYHKCRCDVCKEKYREYYKKGQRIKKTVTHGTVSGYQYYKCRCDECKEAIKQYRQRFTRTSELNRNYSRKSKYNLTREEYDELLEEQNSCCAICRCPLLDFGVFGSSAVIDHNHITGEVRGILCSNCNKGIGLLKDDILILESGIKYLTK